MSTANLFDLDADVGSEDDESFDEETGETRRRINGANGHGDDDDDSSEEEDDDDEEAAAEIRQGFIVDDDEDEESRRRRKKEKRKRRREQEEEQDLDEEDLDLIGELDSGVPAEPQFKRLKRGHGADRGPAEPRGVDDIFNDDEEPEDDLEDRRMGITRRREGVGEFDDFIEQDEDEDQEQLLEDIEVSRRPKKGVGALTGLQSSGLDEAGLEDMRAAFGDGTEYDWALELQEAMDDEQLDPDKPLELKDVFEPSQLADRMLTDEDNAIRSTDVPERLQIARKPFKESELTDEEAAARATEEAAWIATMLWPKKRFDRDLYEPFQKSVAKVLDFLNVEDFEVPFIFQHRKDYLIHAVRAELPPDPGHQDAPEYELRAEKLLNQTDLWEILDLDLKFRALVEKREALVKAYDNVKGISQVQDEVVDDMLPAALTMEEIQDIQDYVHFQYSSELKDISATQAESNGTYKRAGASTSLFFEKLRAGKAYNVVRGFGISADSFAQSALESNQRAYTEDPHERPDDLADQCVDGEEFQTGAQVLKAAKAMFAEELTMSPRMRKLMRQTYYANGHFDCIRTEKGLRKIDDDHPYYQFKYLRNQSLTQIARNPELYLRMLKAEEEGLVEVRLRLGNEGLMKRNLYKILASDNFSEVADAWNVIRREVLDLAWVKLDRIMVRGVKENLKTECENQLARKCREKYSEKLDQAPYKPKGMLLGTTPRVLALTNGGGFAAKDAIIWAWVEEDGRVLENGKFANLRLGNPEKSIPDSADIAKLIELVERRKPDVLAVSGYSADARTLYKDLQAVVDQHELRGSEYEDEDGIERRDKIDVVIVNDEVARLYQNSERSTIDHPGLAPLTKYAVALAKYLQNPMKEYAALGKDITSITFDTSQSLLPQDKLYKYLETAMVDMVNLVGVDINEAVSETYTANLLPYICGLGPRKAAAMLQAINRNGGTVATREELVGDPDAGKLQAVGPKVWANCAGFLWVEFDPIEPASDYLDNTRVHPEDYDLGRKMAADALELDEEDIKAEVDEGGPSAVVKKLIKDEAQEKVNDLILEMYAEQLERNFNQKKRATLETIRAELQQPYEELRRSFALMRSEEIFTMLTGETEESLAEGMTLPVSIRRVFPDHIEVRLDCGIEGAVSEAEFPSGVGMNGVEPRSALQPHQTLQAKVLFINRKQLTAQLSFREDALRRSYRKDVDRDPGEWDDAQEASDKRDMVKQKEDVAGRAQRVIKHPLFRPFNKEQAEEYLGPQSRGDVVIRPSSNGPDHLAVTWKVADNVFQHIDVLELDKENEFSVGRTLRIGGKYNYSDLDELIVNHVKAMARKVDEIVTDDRFQTGSKAQTGKSRSWCCGRCMILTLLAEQWLTAYMDANPKRAMYAFCINREYPGYFYLCFKAGQNTKHTAWPVKIIPNAFELMKNPYPDMKALKNGFKTLWQNEMQKTNGKRRY